MASGASTGGWKLRVRCPKGFGVTAGAVQTLELAGGAATTLSELRTVTANVGKVAASRLNIMVAGAPPQTLLTSPPAADEDTRTVADAGLRDRDTLILERGAEPGAVSSDGTTAEQTGAGAAAAASEEAASPKKARSKAKWGAGHALGSTPSDADVMEDPPPSITSTTGKKNSAGKALLAPGKKDKRALAKTGGHVLGSTPRCVAPRPTYNIQLTHSHKHSLCVLHPLVASSIML